MRSFLICLAIVLPLALTLHSASAESYWAPAGFSKVDPAGRYVEATFDLGRAFSQIDRVLVEMTSQAPVGGGVCTGSSCDTWFLAINLTSSDEAAGFKTVSHDIPGISQFPDLYGEFNSMSPDRLSEAIVTPPNARINALTGQYAHDPWPNFLFAGSGVVRLSMISNTSCILNCASVISGDGIVVPRDSPAMRVVIEGVAAPEPSATDLLAMGILVGCLPMRFRNVRSYSWCESHVHPTITAALSRR